MLNLNLKKVTERPTISSHKLRGPIMVDLPIEDLSNFIPIMQQCDITFKYLKTIENLFDSQVDAKTIDKDRMSIGMRTADYYLCQFCDMAKACAHLLSDASIVLMYSYVQQLGGQYNRILNKYNYLKKQ